MPADPLDSAGRAGRRRAEQVRIAWFLAVGSTAAAVHWSTVVWLVGQHGWAPLAANVLGWLVAFGVSFGGHFGLTFRHHGTPPGRAVRRFFALSATGFAVNESAYALLLQRGGQRYEFLLALVLVGVAVLTYWLSRQWAFGGGGRH